MSSHALGVPFLSRGTFLGGQNPFTSHPGPQQSYARVTPYLNQQTMHHYPSLGGPQGWSRASLAYDPFSQLHNLFLSSLDLPNLTRLTNDPIRHFPWWPPMPAKLASDIPKFEGNLGENSSTHITTYHLWCSSNSFMDDLIKLHFFQRTLTGDAAKWYIELDTTSYRDFSSLSHTFFTHFQLPTRYDIDSHLL